jgi:hypothetical protein
VESLRRQGANPGLGSRLAELFRLAGIPLIETGSLRADGRSLSGNGEWELEWEVLKADLAGLVPMKQVQRLKRLDKQAWQRHERVLYVPTYFAWGQGTQMV